MYSLRSKASDMTQTEQPEAGGDVETVETPEKDQGASTSEATTTEDEPSITVRAGDKTTAGSSNERVESESGNEKETDQEETVNKKKKGKQTNQEIRSEVGFTRHAFPMRGRSFRCRGAAFRGYGGRGVGRRGRGGRGLHTRGFAIRKMFGLGRRGRVFYGGRGFGGRGFGGRPVEESDMNNEETWADPRVAFEEELEEDSQREEDQPGVSSMENDGEQCTDEEADDHTGGVDEEDDAPPCTCRGDMFEARGGRGRGGWGRGGRGRGFGQDPRDMGFPCRGSCQRGRPSRPHMGFMPDPRMGGFTRPPMFARGGMRPPFPPHGNFGGCGFGGPRPPFRPMFVR